MTAPVAGPQAVDPDALWNLAEFEQAAVPMMRDEVRTLVQGGAGAGRAIQANVDAWARWALRPQVLVDVASCDTSTTLLGHTLAAPIMVAPSGMHGLLCADGEVATARAARQTGLMLALSMGCTCEPEAVAQESGPFWMQLYWGADRARLCDIVHRAEAAGACALCLTVDMPVRPWLNGQMRAAQVPLAEAPTPLMQRQFTSESRLTWNHDPRLTWDDIPWLAGLTDVPIVLKGVMTAADATRAVEHGAAAIIVSNHGGRTLERGLATATVLPEIVEAVSGRIPVLVDGGIRSGSDVLCALALGADAILVGRPPLWGLTLAGAAGVARVLELLIAELEAVMAMCGARRVDDIDASMVCCQR